MFDPTAFDNMKTVLDGAAYDLDLTGEVSIYDRKDLIDLASLSRSYSILLAINDHSRTFAQIQLRSSLKQLASELLPQGNFQKQGAVVLLEFSWPEEERSIANTDSVKKLWGSDRIYEEIFTHSSKDGAERRIRVMFNRLFTEEMMDDLLEVLHHVVKTLSRL